VYYDLLLLVTLISGANLLKLDNIMLKGCRLKHTFEMGYMTYISFDIANHVRIVQECFLPTIVVALRLRSKNII
jgi:hypothetical protein